MVKVVVEGRCWIEKVTGLLLLGTRRWGFGKRDMLWTGRIFGRDGGEMVA